MAVKAFTASSTAGRVLLALRRGTHEPGELAELFGGHSPPGLGKLLAAGLIAKDSESTYRVTDAGRAACPFRNPLAGKPATPPEVFSMPRGSLTQGAVRDAIIAAGPDGITRNALVEQFGCTPKSIANHLDRMVNVDGAQVVRLDRGLYVAQRFIGADGLPVKTGMETTSTVAVLDAEPIALTDGDWVPEPLATDPTVETALAARDDELFKQAEVITELRRQLADKEYLASLPTIVEDIDIDEDDNVEFAIYSSGGLDIHSDDCSITLRKPVVAKLRAFLGLFREEAA